MSTIGAEDFYLIDCWPGEVLPNAPKPSGGFDTTQAGNRSTTAIYPTGTKMIGYQDSTVGAGGTLVANRGWYRMMYAQYLDYTSGTDCSAACVVVPACGSTKGRGGVAFTKDISGGNEFSCSGPVGITCTSIGATQYGWIWVSGICPNYDCSQMDITGYLTDTNIVGGGPITSVLHHADGTTGTMLSGPGQADGTGTMVIVGFAWVDDT